MTICAATAACLSSAPLSPIEDPTKRLEFAGFSILPPRGPLWLSGSVATLPDVENRVVYRAVFFRTPADVDPTAGRDSPRIVALVMVRDLGDAKFRSSSDFVASMKTLGARTRQRHRLLASRASLVERADATCAVYDYAAEDSGVILMVQGIRCLHPQWPSYAIDVSYSQRYPAGRQPIALDAEVEPFLGSLAFTPDHP
ncbi:MAG: hypothetical protein ACRELS_19080 [Candidatus Rokuibacteriota bacterium]